MFLPVGIAELTVEDDDLEANESVFLCGLTPSGVVPLEEFIPDSSWRDARKARIKMLGEAMSNFLKPPELVAVGFRLCWEAERLKSLLR